MKWQEYLNRLTWSWQMVRMPVRLSQWIWCSMQISSYASLTAWACTHHQQFATVGATAEAVCHFFQFWVAFVVVPFFFLLLQAVFAFRITFRAVAGDCPKAFRITFRAVAGDCPKWLPNLTPVGALLTILAPASCSPLSCWLSSMSFSRW